ncbi:unnamed protein product (macronuclear) [Paramecium tetraurelia]|uniref:Uncharacterized protein n=1 Tax=Paramecium tetraurelia TaxID=5888 RepID=A0C233_PARTE|nr:uncharacterized protein GSPATT00034327001 [Paramecium tetraurelia]CAK64850.1 unnamed protein product [Paramecium tetraurelia]|eukprot:XP_001432247.1 hypothetical protein (macronuclear) [Paramecium tetraurelia strain d4-2]
MKSYFLSNLIKHIQQKYKEVKNQVNQLQKGMENNIQELKFKNNQLENENNDLRYNIQDLKCINDTIQEEYNMIKQYNEELQHKNKTLENELQKYLIKNDVSYCLNQQKQLIQVVPFNYFKQQILKY